ncbi:MAG: hypothetical protein WA982_12080 [Rubrobacteraceae bacterium]
MQGNSEFFYVPGRYVLRRVGVALDVALGAVPESPLQLVSVLTRLFRQRLRQQLRRPVATCGPPHWVALFVTTLAANGWASPATGFRP